MSITSSTVSTLPTMVPGATLRASVRTVRHERRRIVDGPHEKGQPLDVFRVERQRHEYSRFRQTRPQRVAGIVGDDADDIVRGAGDPEPGTDGFLSLKAASRQCLVDDSRAAGARIRPGKRTSRPHLHAERGEEVRGDFDPFGGHSFAERWVGGHGLPFAPRRCRGRDAGHARERLEHLRRRNALLVLDPRVQQWPREVPTSAWRTRQ